MSPYKYHNVPWHELSTHRLTQPSANWSQMTDADHNRKGYGREMGTIEGNDNDNDNELFIQTKSNEKHHKGNINNTYKNINITTFVPKGLHWRHHGR